MSARISKICLFVYALFFVFSLFLLSVPGDYWPWYAVMAPFAFAPLCFGPRWYRLAGGIALLLAGLLIFEDIEAGKHFRDKQWRSRVVRNTESSEPDGSANGSLPVFH
jgi:hypothetical protein